MSDHFLLPFIIWKNFVALKILMRIDYCWKIGFQLCSLPTLLLQASNPTLFWFLTLGIHTTNRSPSNYCFLKLRGDLITDRKDYWFNWGDFSFRNAKQVGINVLCHEYLSQLGQVGFCRYFGLGIQNLGVSAKYFLLKLLDTLLRVRL